MKNLCLFLLILLHFTAAKADKVLGDVDFSSGEWVMIGVPIHNYQYLPIQQELGTFICKDLSFMKELQRAWDLEYTDADKCDYHYSIKLYKDKEVFRTYTLNLHCGYLTYDGLSYTFDPQLFSRFKAYAKPVDWSRINFENEEMLKKAVSTLTKTPDVYWYDDVSQYKYKGYLNMFYNNIPWDANQDSMLEVVAAEVRAKAGNEDFYVQQKGYTLNGDYIYISYQINCDESNAKKIAKHPNISTKWKAHMEKGSIIRVVAIGVNESRYKKLMGFEK